MTKKKKPGVPRGLLLVAIAVAIGGAALVAMDGETVGLGGARLEGEIRPDDLLLPPGILGPHDPLGPHDGERRRAARDAELIGRTSQGQPTKRARPADLARCGGWEASLFALAAARQAAPERAALDIVNAAFCRARGPVTRQNLVFQMALCVEPHLSIPWLLALAAQQGADADDAWAALAFLGDGEGSAHFLASAEAPLTEHMSIDSFWVHEEWGKKNDAQARALLRPFRALEVLLRRPYFGQTSRSAAQAFVPGLRPSPDLLVELLEAWLRRYPGHAGSDDVALYIARTHLKTGNLNAAAHWYARSCTTGDADAAEESMRGLLACAELFLGEPELSSVLHGLDGAPRLADLLEYVRIRRRAARGDLRGALLDVEHHAARRPDSIFGVAWRRRRQAEVPRGLSSGRRPLAPDDPLCVSEPTTNLDPRPAWAAAARTMRGTYPLFYGGQLRGDGPLLLPEFDGFAAQLRAWETLVELANRADRARGEAEADLRYQIAALHYHDPEVFFPAYAGRGSWLGELFGAKAVAPLLADEDGWARAFRRFEETAHGEWRAALAFADVAAAFPESPLSEKALFSCGQAFRRFAAKARAGTELRADGIRGLFRAFDTFLRVYPDSTMADDAQRALAFWQKMQPTLRVR